MYTIIHSWFENLTSFDTYVPASLSRIIYRPLKTVQKTDEAINSTRFWTIYFKFFIYLANSGSHSWNTDLNAATKVDGYFMYRRTSTPKADDAELDAMKTCSFSADALTAYEFSLQQFFWFADNYYVLLIYYFCTNILTFALILILNSSWMQRCAVQFPTALVVSAFVALLSKKI